MRKKLCTIILFFLIVSSQIVFGKNSSKTKTHQPNKSHNHFKDKTNIERLKRSLDDEDEKPFWANRGKKQIDANPNNNNRNDDHEKISKFLKEGDIIKDEPFWGTRGRRDSSSIENYVDEEYPEFASYDYSNCKNCYGTMHRYSNRDHNLKNTRDDNVDPFWGVRGRRDSNEIEDPYNPFWDNRVRRQDNDPFWGMRGRRKEDPFWGARGRRNDEPFWGNRGRRDDNEPFWGNRGRRQDSEPFWGNRGRRQESEPFWGNRGRRDDDHFWSDNGSLKKEVSWGVGDRQKEDLKETILSAINDVTKDIEHLSRLKKSEGSFWSNRGRDSKLKSLFSRYRDRIYSQQVSRRFDGNFKNTDPGTLTDSRIYADEPNYILVERSSRSSGEADDPFIITRGQKYKLNYKLFKAARDRRGALEEIVKSVRNDPYYIARGKKDDVANSTTNEELAKVKELVCSAVDLTNLPKGKGKLKREIDADRDRRTILKKLTAQLQNDPYFVSRGKKSDSANNNEDYVREFITEIAEKCY